MEPAVILRGLAFPEAPRWDGDRLWLTDQHAGDILTVGIDGNAERVVTGIDRPGGLGTLPNGTTLVVLMNEQRVCRIVHGELELHADLSGLASAQCNDMVVDDYGRAYVGNFGYDIEAGEPKSNAELILIEPNGEARVVSRELIFPNGSVITPDRDTLIVAETFASRISAFDIDEDGSLRNHRVWAELDDKHPDGISLDAEGAVWFACPKSAQVHRVLEGGEIVHSVTPSVPPYACMLGGPERKTLFVVGSATNVAEEAARTRSGTVEVIDVDVPGAGIP